MARAKKYWLMKCEPAAYTIDDLARDGVTGWEGVRNYQARNYMRDDMEPGDGVLFYASNAEPSGVMGLAEIAKNGYPDPFAFKKGHRYHDEKSNPEEPTWYTVEIRFIKKFADVVSLDELREQRSLAGMMVLQKGSRLSIQPVTSAQYEAVVALGQAKESQEESPLPHPTPTRPAPRKAAKAAPRKARKPAARKPAASKPAASKPATSKPATSKATSKAATRKPATSKPATSKPATSKPAASKPAARKATRWAK
jgi:predicted RNA-binding protein with PUA-like domain